MPQYRPYMVSDTTLEEYLSTFPRQKVHISELDKYIADKDEFYALIGSNAELATLGTFDYATGWFYLEEGRAAANRQNKRILSKELAKNLLMKSVVFSIFFVLGLVFLSNSNFDTGFDHFAMLGMINIAAAFFVFISIAGDIIDNARQGPVSGISLSGYFTGFF